MTNEYLFTDDTHRKEIKNYSPPEDIEKTISNNIKDTDLWSVSFSADSNDIDSANKLSDVHDYIMKLNPLILECGSSAYYNGKLFPLINSFERKFRKLIYIAFSFLTEEPIKEEANKLIKVIEKENLNYIFKFLFFDIKLTSTILNDFYRSNDRDGKYKKSELLEFLTNNEEVILWEKMFNKNPSPTLEKEYRDVQKYRNDVMHAHNIRKERYKKSEKLFKQINKELYISIEEMIKNPKTTIGKDFDIKSIREIFEFYLLVKSLNSFKTRDDNPFIKYYTSHHDDSLTITKYFTDDYDNKYRWSPAMDFFKQFYTHSTDEETEPDENLEDN
ncbi:MAG: hypothetical protein LBL93_05625 [Ruminococcus sp.]|jgi:hypothetical protein|nr:hypothetical protein [Ruminococcus sp.]